MISDDPSLPEQGHDPVPEAAHAACEPEAITITMLGGFEVRDASGGVVQLPVRKAEALLALLALQPGRAVARDKICGLLWPTVREAQARHSLRQTLLSIRKALPVEVVSANARALSVDAKRVRVDVAELLQQLELGSREALIAAARTYRGDLLEGLSVGEPPFEDWLSFERERVRAAVTRRLTELIALHTAANELADATSVCSQLLQLEPLREEAHRTLMRLQVRQGRRASALQHYQSLVRTLRANLDTQPDAQTQELYAEIEQAAGARELPEQPSEPAHRQASLDAPDADFDVPAIVRTAELLGLHAARERARTERAEVCFVIGEAGVGKTHLCSQFAREVRAGGGRVLRGRCFESEQVLPFSCWVNLLADAQIGRDTRLLAALPSDSRRELARLLPELEEASPPQAAEDALALFRALDGLFARLADAGELVLILEDLHWADAMSLRVLCYLARRRATARTCFVIATARKEELGSTAFLPNAIAELEREQLLSRVLLSPFSQAETSQLAAHWAARLALSQAGWSDRIWTLSEGNALVIVESARALAQQGVELDLERLSVPERVRALIRQRLARMSTNARELAALAAVYGRELEPSLLQAALEPAQLVAAVEELIDAQLMRSLGDRVAFTHDRIRETLYEEMLPVRRRLLHGQIAVAIERRGHGEELDPATLGQVGYHHAKAGNAAAAIPLLVRFSEHARRTYALGEALAALEQALHCALQLPAAQRPRAVIKIMIRQAFCLAFLGRFEDLSSRLEQQAGALEGLNDAELAGWFHFWWGFALTFLGKGAEAELQAARALEHATASGALRTRGYAHSLSSYLAGFAGRFDDGVTHGLAAIELLRGDTDQLPEAIMFAYVSVVSNRLWLGDWQSALAAAQAAHGIAESADSVRAQAMAALSACLVHVHTLRWDLAHDAARRALELSKTPFTVGPAWCLLACALAGRGEARSAVVILDQVVAKLEQSGIRAWKGSLMSAFSQVLLLAGDAARAKQVATDAANSAEAAGARHVAAAALRARARAEHALGELTAAETHLLAALASFEAMQAPIDIAHTLFALADLEVTRRAPARARTQLERARALYAAHDLEEPLRRVAKLEAGL